MSARARGVKSGMRIMDFQDSQLARQAERKLSDPELLAEMRSEFPGAVGKIFTADLATALAIVRGVRALYNAGRHSKGAARPAEPVPEYREGAPIGRAKIVVPAALPPVPGETAKPERKRRVRKPKAAPVVVEDAPASEEAAS